MKTLVLGASSKPHRYSYLASEMLQEYDHEIVAVGRREEQLDNWDIIKGQPAQESVHTVTLYLNAKNQEEYYDYIISLNPKRVIFNPGAENPELVRMLEQKGIEALQACTLVLLRTGQY